MEQEDDDKVDPLVSGYETNLSLFPDDFSSYELEVDTAVCANKCFSIFENTFSVSSIRLHVRPRINQQSGCEWMNKHLLPSASVY
ncbi:hypothetical protein Aduo_005336 [Ancylostoma duodenale]